MLGRAIPRLRTIGRLVADHVTLSDAITVLGFLLFVFGIGFQFSAPVACIVAGAMLLVAGVLSHFRGAASPAAHAPDMSDGTA